MGRRKKRRYQIIENLEILDLVSEGKSLARHEEKIVFVTKAVPGDVVDVQVTKKREKYLEATAIKFHRLSKMRIDPFCKHFEVCGGCKWQQVPYDKQLHFKQKQVASNLTHIGKLEIPELEDIKGSEKTTFYRNKLEYTFSSNRWLTKEEIDESGEIKDMNGLGFHIPRHWDKVLDIKKCWLQADPSNNIRLEVKKYAIENGLTFFNLRVQEGFLRNLIIRTSTTGEIMVIVVFFHEDVEKRKGLLNHLKEKFPEITSLMYVINGKANDSLTDQEVLPFAGNDYIFEEMEGLKFKIGPKSFYQTNSEQAYELYKIAREFAQLDPNDVVYDLYTGTGTIACFVAKNCKKVVGVEYVPEAIEDAKVNAQNNNLDNTSFFAGDMKDLLTIDFIDKNGQPDVIITDPPRAGMHEDVIRTIEKVAPKRIVYISCNPATQARDIGLLADLYDVKKIQPVDMFPHTHHVENVVLLEKR